MIRQRFYIPFLIFLLSTVCISGQTRKQLETQRKKLNLKIKKVNKLLFEAKNDQKNALVDLSALNQKIGVREKLIETIHLEVKLLSAEIVANENKIAKLNTRLSALKEDYASMIFKSYKSKSQQSRTMFLLSSRNFRQAYKRLEYMKQYASFRKKQGEEIIIQTDLIKQFIVSLNLQKQEKDTLILSENEQKNKIEQDKKNQEKLVSEIKKKEKKYKSELRKSIREEKKIAQKIDKLIRAAIARANRKTRVSSNKTKKNEFILSPEAKALAARFELNKGKLPWPLRESLVIRRFGKQPHPTFSGITINSSGLHLATKKGEYASAIFGGTVLAIQLTTERKKNVLVQHGNYITAYNNLENSLVKMGDTVTIGQELGKVYTDKVTGKTTLIFLLFKNTTRLNPASWMLKR
ncbi:peptidoglycan DD-metalloendopeptidase family protein [Polaribacter sp.]|nr:peptidoglycan DD-metalloendopeptidase family protein [Polaribacter sp.]MDA9363627.1 peptidoglycan DD-metalloendopeptidase family protein [Polaribacter sp.]MDA9976704.1 peptidoglycan DD-metalloendopeptidase family protein [Polaribacter sp.]MDB0040148.1 peptidoglycan DD-metalloendopeptidase family protein [Polaribacter sp.]MDB4166973.1 peptidoglycan DD-metalloendopeptidase family protein [Polaribacter sp.]